MLRLFLRSQFQSFAMRRIADSGMMISGYALSILGIWAVMNLLISSDLIASKTKILHLERRALLILKLGFSVVAPIKVITPFSTNGNNVSCWALFQRWISSKKISVCFPYFWFNSAWSRIFLRSSFLLVTPERINASAWIVSAIILARVVFPHPGGPRKSIEGTFPCLRKEDSGLSAHIICSWPTNSSIFWGLRSDESGSDMVRWWMVNVGSVIARSPKEWGWRGNLSKISETGSPRCRSRWPPFPPY